MTPSAAQKLEKARLREEAARPVAAEVFVDPTGHAAVRFLDADGSIREPYKDVVHLPGRWTCGGDPLQKKAGGAIHAHGFRIDSGWETVDEDTARTAIIPGPEYLAYIGRHFGPVPELGELPSGVSAKPTQRGRWTVSYQNRHIWNLTWTARMGDDLWALYSTPADEEVAAGASPCEVLAEVGVGTHPQAMPYRLKVIDDGATPYCILHVRDCCPTSGDALLRNLTATYSAADDMIGGPWRLCEHARL